MAGETSKRYARQTFSLALSSALPPLDHKSGRICHKNNMAQYCRKLPVITATIRQRRERVC